MTPPIGRPSSEHIISSLKGFTGPIANTADPTKQSP